MSTTKTMLVSSAAVPGSESRIAQRFGGHYANSWMTNLPSSWTPYIQLARLHRPQGVLIVICPHLIGVFHAAILLQAPLRETLRVAAIMIVGAVFCNNGAHAWNDLVDAPIDAHVERTKTRPIPRGAVSKTAAFLFAASQAVLAAACLLFLPAGARAPCVPTIATILYYPFAKRQIFAPQVVMGLCMSLVVLLGSAAMGLERPWRNPSTQCLMAAAMLWVVLFDTIYAHMDLKDDVKIGVKSLAVFLQGYTRPALAVLAVGISTSLYGAGVNAGVGAAYYGISVGACSLYTGAMVALLDLDDRVSCGKWSVVGFPFVGLTVVAGLLVTYLTSL